MITPSKDPNTTRWGCEVCGDEYEDHPLAFEPHLCPNCEDEEDEA